jgi:hypothetical protein
MAGGRSKNSKRRILVLSEGRKRKKYNVIMPNPYNLHKHSKYHNYTSMCRLIGAAWGKSVQSIILDSPFTDERLLRTALFDFHHVLFLLVKFA